MSKDESTGHDVQWSSRVLDKESGFSFLVVWKAPAVPFSVDASAAMVVSMKEAIEQMTEAGFLPLTNSYQGQDVISVPYEDRTAKRPASAPRPQPPARATEFPSTTGSAPAQTTLDTGSRVDTSGHDAVGQGAITKIVVEEKDGKPGQYRVAFHIANRQRPIYDNRGPEIVATVFRPNCFTDAWTKEKLGIEGVYKPSDWEGELVAMSGKSKSRGFWDVLAVKRQ